LFLLSSKFCLLLKLGLLQLLLGDNLRLIGFRSVCPLQIVEELDSFERIHQAKFIHALFLQTVLKGFRATDLGLIGGIMTSSSLALPTFTSLLTGRGFLAEADFPDLLVR
jgi:hypothetical protein